MRRSKALIPHPTDPRLFLVPLTRGLFALIDAVDAEEVEKFWWHVNLQRTGKAYAARWSGGRLLYLHRMIADRCGIVSALVDHENRDGLDCRRENLRAATQSGNVMNSSRQRGAVLPRGVSRSSANRWKLEITANKKRHYIGVFATLDEAAKASEEARRRLHGKFFAPN